VSSPYSDLDRPPLSERALRRDLLHEGSVWTDLRVVARTGSTNADVADAARRGEAEGLVVVAESQDAGRGRLDREWVSPPRAGLTFSVLWRPTAPRATWSWLPLLAGLAVRRAVLEVSEVDATLKWPNDVLVGTRKLAGLLAEVHGAAVVLGIGLNVSTRPDELLPTATSLAVEQAPVTDRETLLRSVLRALGAGYDTWSLRHGDASEIRGEYVGHCSTIGAEVRVSLTGGHVLSGRATGIAADGQLEVVDSTGVLHRVGSGDVEHVRPG
jgi:BirA family biotin operon repressor/biotin-[acetyl-CoA-carboxylase] ligase